MPRLPGHLFGSNDDCTHHHDSVRDAQFSVSQSTSLRREVPALIPGAKSLLADSYLPCWKCGRPAALDASPHFRNSLFTVLLQCRVVHSVLGRKERKPHVPALELLL